jgi:hypothetical protein
LLVATLAAPAVEESDVPVPLELLDDDVLLGAVVIETLDPSLKSIVVVEEPLLFAAVCVVAPLVDASSICSRLSIPPPPP